MNLAQVVGTVVSTQKDPKLAGLKLLLCQNLSIDLTPTSSFVVAVDAVGAGNGEVVVYAGGSSARLTDSTQGLPVDSVIMAIVDSMEIHGKIAYTKHPESEPAFTA